MKLHKKLLLSLIAFFSLLGLGSFNAQAATKQTDAQIRTSIYKQAKANLGKPYVWGATGSNAFDCSGLTSYVFKKAAKISLPRTADQQYAASKRIAYRNAKKGDLVFFGWGGYISHVGIYVGGGKMIDAQNRGVVTEKVVAPWWNYYATARVTGLK